MPSLGLKQVREFGLNFPLNPDLSIYIYQNTATLSANSKFPMHLGGIEIIWNWLLSFIFFNFNLGYLWISRQIQTVSSQSPCFFLVLDGFSPRCGSHPPNRSSVAWRIPKARPVVEHADLAPQTSSDESLEVLGTQGVNASHRARVQG